jgi:hypothetical protein
VFQWRPTLLYYTILYYTILYCRLVEQEIIKLNIFLQTMEVGTNERAAQGHENA